MGVYFDLPFDWLEEQAPLAVETKEATTCVIRVDVYRVVTLLLYNSRVIQT